jgi:hypothetical protein
MAIAMLLSACEKPKVIEDLDLLSNLKSNSVDTLIFNSSKYTLDAYLYRNLFPGGPIPTARPLIAYISLVNSDGIEISNELNITKLYVIKDPLIWVSIPTLSNDDNIPEYKLTKFSKDGPEWQTGILVDVVIEVSNKTTKDKYLIISKEITIDKVEK